MKSFRLRMFGQVSLRQEAGDVESFGTVRAAKLLVLLALARGGRMPREHLAEQLWPDDFYDATRLRLRQEIHRLKRALGSNVDLIGSSATEVWLDREQVATDLDLLEQAARGPLNEEVEPLLLEPFLPGWDDPWVIAHRHHVDSLQVRAAVAITTRTIEAGQAAETHVLIQKLIAKFPLDEDLRKVAVAAHAELGSIAAAVAEFQDFRRKVKEQLGVDTPDVSADLVRTLTAKAEDSAKEADWSGTIPAATDPIYGREDLVVRVLELLQKARVVTLVGPGGIGKTRLATEVAQRMAAGAGRVAFISLAEVASPELWSRDALSQLGEDPPAETDAVRYLASVVSQQPTTIVLDNLETVLPSAADSLKQLLKLAPQLRVLITSVTPSQLTGEVLIPVGPLDPRLAGLDLLRGAFRNYRPSSEVSEEDERHLEAIAVQLDGYPLALRLVSARLRLLSPRDLLGQLEQAMSRTGSTDLPERHRSLETALASCFDSLTPELRSAIERISAYPGGMGMDLCAIEFEDEPYLDIIESLLDLALLTLDDHLGLVRVRMLAPVRRFVQQRLTDERAEELHERHVESLFRFLDVFDVAPWRPMSIHTNDLLGGEADNLVPAWWWALEHRTELALRSVAKIIRLESGRGRALAMLQPMFDLRPTWQSEPPELVAELELALAHLCFISHREERAPEPLARAREVIEPLHNDHWNVLLALSNAIYLFRKDFFSVKPVAEEVLALSMKLNNRYLAGRAHRILGHIADYTHRPKDTLSHLQRAYEALEETGAETEIASLGTYYASHLWFNGDTEESAATMAKSKALLARTREPIGRAFMHETEGRIALASGHPQEAEQCFREALRLWEALDSPFQQADQYHSLSRALIAQDRWREARKTVLAAADRWMLDSNMGGLCCTLVLLAQVLQQSGDTDHARQVIAFAKDFESAHRLIIVESELTLRSEVEADLGGECSHDLPVTEEQAKALFDLIR